jgi:hypothetical protein
MGHTTRLSQQVRLYKGNKDGAAGLPRALLSPIKEKNAYGTASFNEF